MEHKYVLMENQYVDRLIKHQCVIILWRFSVISVFIFLRSSSVLYVT